MNQSIYFFPQLYFNVALKDALFKLYFLSRRQRPLFQLNESLIVTV